MFAAADGQLRERGYLAYFRGSRKQTTSADSSRRFEGEKRVVYPSSRAANKSFDSDFRPCKVTIRFCLPMFASNIIPPVLPGDTSSILQFPTETSRAVRSLRHMTSQLLLEAAQVIPNQQLLINVVSRRVRQLGLGHRPLVEATPRSSLTDIALREIIAGKLTYELAPETKPAEGA